MEIFVTNSCSLDSGNPSDVTYRACKKLVLISGAPRNFSWEELSLELDTKKKIEIRMENHVKMFLNFVFFDKIERLRSGVASVPLASTLRCAIGPDYSLAAR